MHKNATDASSEFLFSFLLLLKFFLYYLVCISLTIEKRRKYIKVSCLVELLLFLYLRENTVKVSSTFAKKNNNIVFFGMWIQKQDFC